MFIHQPRMPLYGPKKMLKFIVTDVETQKNLTCSRFYGQQRVGQCRCRLEPCRWRGYIAHVADYLSHQQKANILWHNLSKRKQ
jgi:hypothetical protein